MSGPNRPHYWLIALGAVAVVGAAMYGQSVWRGRGGIETEEVAPAQSLLVQVSGAVVTPKLLRLSRPKTIRELVALCDGYLPEADLAAFDEKTLVTESVDLSIPFRFPSATEPVSLSDGAEGQIAIVPGLDETIAARIVKDRNLHGPFYSVDDLLRVEGMTIERLEAARASLRP